MIVYKIIGCLLVSSPLIFSNQHTFFPYSYMGVILICLLGILLENQGMHKIFDMIFIIFSTMTIVLLKPYSYLIVIGLFFIYRYVMILLQNRIYDNEWLAWIMAIGVASLILLYTYSWAITLNGMILLVGEIFLATIIKREQLPISPNIPQNDIDSQDWDIQIPMIDENAKNEADIGGEYVIPTSDQE